MGDSRKVLGMGDSASRGKEPRRCEWLEMWKRKEPRVSRPWAGSVSEAGTGHGTVAGCQRQHVREGSKIGEGEERGLRWGWDGPAASIPEKNCGGLEAGGSGHSTQCSPVASMGAALGSVLAQGCPHWPSVVFALLPIHIYLFIDFYEVFLPPNPNCSCFPDHPLPPKPSSCLCSCLSVCHKGNKNSKQQDLCVISGERWLGSKVLRQEYSTFSGPVRAQVLLPP